MKQKGHSLQVFLSPSLSSAGMLSRPLSRWGPLTALTDKYCSRPQLSPASEGRILRRKCGIKNHEKWGNTRIRNGQNAYIFISLVISSWILTKYCPWPELAQSVTYSRCLGAQIVQVGVHKHKLMKSDISTLSYLQKRMKPQGYLSWLHRYLTRESLCLCWRGVDAVTPTITHESFPSTLSISFGFVEIIICSWDQLEQNHDKYRE